MQNIDTLLTERGNTYGDFRLQSHVAQQIKGILHQGTQWGNMVPFQREALEMMAVKLSRILTGDCCLQDSWQDIAGYATLVASRLPAGGGGVLPDSPSEPESGPVAAGRLSAAMFAGQRPSGPPPSPKVPVKTPGQRLYEQEPRGVLWSDLPAADKQHYEFEAIRPRSERILPNSGQAGLSNATSEK